MVTQIVPASATVQDITISETEGHALRRLLTKARAEGVRIWRDSAGRYWSPSTTTRGTVYALTAYSCTCKGFQGHQRCKHYAALLSALGWLPEGVTEPDPTEPTIAAYTPICHHCDGHGEVSYQYRTGTRTYATAWQSCTPCGGTGNVIAA